MNNIENEIEKLLTLTWEIRQSKLVYHQRRFIKKMVDFLKKNPETSIGVYPQFFDKKEKEYILFFEAKKKYFLDIKNKKAQSFSKRDSIKVDEMSVKDTLFVQYLNKQIKNSTTFTIQDKCSKIVSAAKVNAQFEELNAARNTAFMSFFKKGEVEKRVKMYKGKAVVPYNGFSFYKIDYRGKLPESLIKAYQQIEKLNDETPRKKFKNAREQNAKDL